MSNTSLSIVSGYIITQGDICIDKLHITRTMASSGNTEFQTAEFESIEKIIGFSPRDPLNGFVEMWYRIFLWTLFSSFLVHIVAGAISFSQLRRHKMGRFAALVIVLMGLLSPLTGGAVTSAAIAGVYRASGFEMAPLYAFVYGVGQTIVVIFISFTRILATL